MKSGFSISSARAAKLTRGNYEKRPYPDTSKVVVTRARWTLPPLEWIYATWRDAVPAARIPSQRILVAGCGTGSEAFALRKAFPKAQIVAVDFSPRSISIALDLQKKFSRRKPIDFRVADLTSPRFSKGIGQFDFISCHGVLSYIPHPEVVLRNLARCLTPDGAIYLAVNGIIHFSVALREALPLFDVAMNEIKDDRHLRSLLRLLSLVEGTKDGRRWRKGSAAWLGGDLFGPLIHNLSLSEWSARCTRAGLHLQSSFHAQHALRHVLQDKTAPLLIPKSRGEACIISELLQTKGFHRLLLTRRPVPRAPWRSFEKLLNWAPDDSGLYKIRLPARLKTGTKWTTLRRVTLTSEPFGTRIDAKLPEWEIETLRRVNGKTSLRQILQRIPFDIPQDTLRDQLYVLYQLGVLNFRKD